MIGTCPGVAYSGGSAIEFKAKKRRAARVVLTAVGVALGAAAMARADGTFIGSQVSFTQTRSWNYAADMGLNWNGDTTPTGLQSLEFTECGDGSIDLGFVAHNHQNVSFDDWVTYTLGVPGGFGGTLGLNTMPSATLTVGSSVAGTYGSDYFDTGSSLASNIQFVPNVPTTISFAGADSGVFRISGQWEGGGNVTLSRPVGTGTGELYVDNLNQGYGGTVYVNPQTSFRMVQGGSFGTGTLVLQGGSLDFLSSVQESTGGNLICSSGTISAGPNYEVSGALPTFGITELIYPPSIDSATSATASVTFNADNGYGFAGAASLVLSNTNGFMGATRIVTVNLGDNKIDNEGSRIQTGPDMLNKNLVTVEFPGLSDFKNVTDVPLTLTKAGGGVLEIDGNNSTSSKGAKIVLGGTLRFNVATGYGTTNGAANGPAQSVTLETDGTGTVPAALGVAYDTPIPANLVTTGTIPGQSGAFDIDMMGAVSTINQTYTSTTGTTALRLGSSSVSGGSTSGMIFGYPLGSPTQTFYLGGGGGILTIKSALGNYTSGFPGTLDMGTSGTLLPGLVELGTAAGGGGATHQFYTGQTLIHAGTLEIPIATNLTGSSGTYLESYSTNLTTGASYTGAPNADPFNGPGQLLLANNVVYNYGAGGSFGTAGLLLSGGAIGYTGNIAISALPGAYGATILSALSQSDDLAPAYVATNILHFGGEYSTGTMTSSLTITDNLQSGAPVALLKSGINSILDLSTGGANYYSGGAGILGGTIAVNEPSQIGSTTTGGPGGAIVITGGGILHIVSHLATQSNPVFGQILRVANGPFGRASQVNVDSGVIAAWNGGSGTYGRLEADATQSVLEKIGIGELDILPPSLNASVAPANSWGLKVTAGLLKINQLPGIASAVNGFVVFNGGTLEMVSPNGPAGGFAIASATQYSENYGFAALVSYAGTNSTLDIDDQAFFRTDGNNAGNWMGTVAINMGPNSVFKMSGNANGGDTYGTGDMNFSNGNVQFTPVGSQILFPSDGAFTLHLNNGVLFSGTTVTTLNGNLYFNDTPASTNARIDAATIDNTPTPTVSTWTIAGTGLTSWNGTVTKDQTQAIPGAAGPYVTGTVNINRCEGAPVQLSLTGATLDVEYGIVNAGGTADPFTDNSSGATIGTHVNVINNSSASSGFNITAGAKAIGTLSGTGSTTVDAGTSLTASYARQNTLTIGSGALTTIRSSVPRNTSSTVSVLNNLVIAQALNTWTGTLNLSDNDLDVTGGNLGTVTSQVEAGLNVGNGYWNGNGIQSSTAAGNATHLTALGVIQNNQSGVALFTGGHKFDGINPGAGDILVKYTYWGDCNLSGNVDGSDYSLIDYAYNANKAHPGMYTGWFNGDFNYDGVIDGSDYTLIDDAFNMQGGTLAVSIASPTAAIATDQIAGTSAVPEPTMLSLSGLAALSLLGRRRLSAVVLSGRMFRNVP